MQPNPIISGGKEMGKEIKCDEDEREMDYA
jgi:hypothetical protein